MMMSFSTLAAIAMAATAAEHAPPSLCKMGEQTVISGAVEDDFGLDVSVCVMETHSEEFPGTTPRITIRWSGEGGGDAVSCIPGHCDGVIEYSRYTSPHLTILQLAWAKNGHVQSLHQTLSRAGWNDPMVATTTHTWLPAGSPVSDVDESTFPVRTDAMPLALMKLETLLERKSWTEQLLCAAPRGEHP